MLWLSVFCVFYIRCRGLVCGVSVAFLGTYNTHNRDSPAQFENRIKPRDYVRPIMRNTMYEKAPFC